MSLPWVNTSLPAVACVHVVEQGVLYLDHGLGEAVVAHRYGRVQQGAPGDEVAGEDYWAVKHVEFGQHQAIPVL